MRMVLGWRLLVLLVAPVAAQDRLTSPYRNQASTSIRGFTEKEIDDLREGAGMGLARAAELNSYPGPRHVLEAVRQGRFRASEDQIRRVAEIFERMKGQAQRLGKSILDEEARLEGAFRARTVTDSDLQSRVARIARLQGELRAVHLSAHLATRATLTDQQVEEYDKLRGYTTSPVDAPAHQHRH